MLQLFIYFAHFPVYLFHILLVKSLKISQQTDQKYHHFVVSKPKSIPKFMLVNEKKKKKKERERERVGKEQTQNLSHTHTHTKRKK